jgi:hypothetical protein
MSNKLLSFVLFFALISNAIDVPDGINEEENPIQVISDSTAGIGLIMSAFHLNHPEFGGVAVGENSQMVQYLGEDRVVNYQNMLNELVGDPEIAFGSVVPGNNPHHLLGVFHECVEKATRLSLYKVSPEGIKEHAQLKIYTFIEEFRHLRWIDGEQLQKDYGNLYKETLSAYCDGIDNILDYPDRISLTAGSELSKLLNQSLPEFNTFKRIHNQMFNIALGYMTHKLLMYRSALDIFG